MDALRTIGIAHIDLDLLPDGWEENPPEENMTLDAIVGTSIQAKRRWMVRPY